MMLLNLNQTYELCYGTRMIVTRLGNMIVEAEIMTGKDAGEQILIPRIQLSPLDTMHPFTLCQSQYPLRLCYEIKVKNKV